MTESKKTPELRFPGFKEPWEEKKLGEVFEFRKGRGISKSDLSNNGTKCILYGQLYTIYNEVIENVESYTEIDEKKLLFSKNGDILIPSSGETALDMSLSSALLLDGIAIGGDINILRPKYNNTNSRFISYQINSVRKFDLAKIAEGASVIHLYNSSLENIKATFPSLAEQEKIGSFFSSLDKKLDLQKDRLEELKSYKKGMMQRIFDQEIRFKDEKGRNYPDWQEKKLGEISDVLKGQQLNRKSFINTGKYYVLNGGRDLSGWTNDWNTEANIISISEGGESCGFVNFNKRRFWSGGHLYTIQNLKDIANNKYLYHFLKYSERLIMRLRVGSGLPNIQIKSIRNFKINLPSLPEQEKIANFLSALDRKIELEEEKLRSYEEFKKGLMQRMFV